MTPDEDNAIDAVELARAQMIHAHAALQLAYLDPATPEAAIDAAHGVLADADNAFAFAMLDWWKAIEVAQATAELATAEVH